MSIVLSLLSLLPRDLVCHVLEYDSRFSVKAGIIRKIGRLSKQDHRFQMLKTMFQERKMCLEWFQLEDWNDLSPTLVIPVNRYDKYALCIFEAEYFREDTGEISFEWIREFVFIRGVKHMELLHVY